MEIKKYQHLAISADTKSLYEDVRHLMRKRGDKVSQDLVILKALEALKKDLENNANVIIKE